jgi:hypothetical protein
LLLSISPDIQYNMPPANSVNDPSDRIAITFGIITAMLAVAAIIIAWMQYRKRHIVPQLPDVQYNIGRLALHGSWTTPTTTTATVARDMSSAVEFSPPESKEVVDTSTQAR